MLLLGRRLPFPPSSELFGKARLSVGFDEDGEKNKEGSEEDARPSAASLMEVYIRRVADLRRRQFRRASRMLKPKLEGICQGFSQSTLDELAPPLSLLEGLAVSAAPFEEGSGFEFSEEERRTILLRVVEASLVPFLRKVHLLIKAVYPDQ